jgi:asparagine synthase (glutamine-hydrolysing)
MCGIVGFTLPGGLSAEERLLQFGGRLRRMTASLFHRGPDSQQALLLDGAALGQTRLSIVDPHSGHQPMTHQQSGVTVVFNGEIFNYLELREQLADRYCFRTRCDTEVILAAFLSQGIDCVRGFIGQFAFALWDPRDQTLWLARDRVGVCPLYYCLRRDALAFASEAKAIFAGEWVSPEIDRVALKDTLHLWVPVPPRSAFVNILQLPPGATARYARGELSVRRYWDLDLSPGTVDLSMGEGPALGELEELLSDAVRLRLRADVPVAAYLSGGIDSSLICAIAQGLLGGKLQTFSVAFEEARYDERAFQSTVAEALGTEHRSVIVGNCEIAELMPAVVEHTEQILLRSAPAPFLKLAAFVRSRGTKVVLTGEGADEVFWGYDLFKETAIRQFWARQPESKARSKLLTRIYPYLSLSQQSPAMLRQFYRPGLETTSYAGFSHLIRWTNSGRIARFLSADFAQEVADRDPVRSMLETLPRAFSSWKPLARAQYLEMQTLLSGYLLSSQGDRVLMGNSVEGRFPFLDHRLIEFAARLPPRLKLHGLTEKFILKRYAARVLPEVVTQRHKFPYRAPIAEAFCGAAAPAWTRELLSREAIDATGIFDGEKVQKLRVKLGRASAAASEADSMALMAVASTQLLAEQFSRKRTIPAARVESVTLATCAEVCYPTCRRSEVSP